MSIVLVIKIKWFMFVIKVFGFLVDGLLFVFVYYNLVVVL